MGPSITYALRVRRDLALNFGFCLCTTYTYEISASLQDYSSPHIVPVLIIAV